MRFVCIAPPGSCGVHRASSPREGPEGEAGAGSAARAGGAKRGHHQVSGELASLWGPCYKTGRLTTRPCLLSSLSFTVSSLHYAIPSSLRHCQYFLILYPHLPGVRFSSTILLYRMMDHMSIIHVCTSLPKEVCREQTKVSGVYSEADTPKLQVLDRILFPNLTHVRT